MNGQIWVVLGQIVLVIHLFSAFTSAYNRVCYHTNWAQYRVSPAKFLPSDIDPFLCTHIIYSFASLKNDKLATYEWNDEQMYKQTMALKNRNPALKILIAVGGWNAGGERFSSIVSSVDRMSAFATQSVSFMTQYGFDGLDVDWEYPGDTTRGGTSMDKQRFTQFMQILRGRFDNNTQKKFLLTAAFSGSPERSATSYDLPRLALYLDFINLMTYDFHGSWEKTVGHHTALNPEVKAGVAYYKSNGMPASKIMLGMATYGRSFTLSDPTNYRPGAPTSGPGNAGVYTRAAGDIAYYEICKLLKEGYTKVWDAAMQAPYAYKGNQWIGYDDARTFEIKSNYIKQEGLGGGMVWALPKDDFNNQCGRGRYPLIGTMKRVLESGTINPPPVTPSPVTTQAPVTANPIQGAPTCSNVFTSCPYRVSAPGMFYDSGDATAFWVCFGTNGVKCMCPSGTYFDPCVHRCNTLMSYLYCVNTQIRGRK